MIEKSINGIVIKHAEPVVSIPVRKHTKVEFIAALGVDVFTELMNLDTATKGIKYAQALYAEMTEFSENDPIVIELLALLESEVGVPSFNATKRASVFK